MAAASRPSRADARARSRSAAGSSLRSASVCAGELGRGRPTRPRHRRAAARETGSVIARDLADHQPMPQAVTRARPLRSRPLAAAAFACAMPGIPEPSLSSRRPSDQRGRRSQPGRSSASGPPRGAGSHDPLPDHRTGRPAPMATALPAARPARESPRPKWRRGSPRRLVAAAAEPLLRLPASSRLEHHPRTHAVAVGTHAFQPQGQPVTALGGLVVQDRRAARSGTGRPRRSGRRCRGRPWPGRGRGGGARTGRRRAADASVRRPSGPPVSNWIGIFHGKTGS